MVPSRSVGWQEIAVASGTLVAAAAALRQARKAWLMLAETTIAVRRIYAEFRPDNGDSLRDRFDAVAACIESLKGRMEDLGEQVADLRRRVARLEVE